MGRNRHRGVISFECGLGYWFYPHGWSGGALKLAESKDGFERVWLNESAKCRETIVVAAASSPEKKSYHPGTRYGGGSGAAEFQCPVGYHSLAGHTLVHGQSGSIQLGQGEGKPGASPACTMVENRYPTAAFSCVSQQ